MILLPAIDILGGKAVRLAQGSFEEQTVYDDNPVEASRRWAAAGARALHVVDLDGAREGRPVNVDQIARITRVAQIPVQVGGGVRSLEAVHEVLAAGAARVVLGTGALRDLDLLDEALALLGERLVVSVDARAGRVATSGWREELDIPLREVARRVSARGVRQFVYSSIERDGMLAGPDLDGAREIARAVRGSFIYSGGIASIEHMRALVALGAANLVGVIVGKALYEQRFTLSEAQRALDEGVAGGRHP